MAEIRMKTGTRIEEKEAKRLDASRMGLGLIGMPRGAEVEGQARKIEWIGCPWCGTPCRCPVDSGVDWYRCGSCGGAYRE